MKMNKFYMILLLAVFFVTSGCSNQSFSTDNLASPNTLMQTSGVEDYRIGAADLLDIKVFQADEWSREVRVDAHGRCV